MGSAAKIHGSCLRRTASILGRRHPECGLEATVKRPWCAERAGECDLIDCNRERHRSEEMLRVRELLPAEVIPQRHSDQVRNETAQIRPREVEIGRKLLGPRGGLRSVAGVKVQLRRSFETPPIGVTRTSCTLP